MSEVQQQPSKTHEFLFSLSKIFEDLAQRCSGDLYNERYESEIEEARMEGAEAALYCAAFIAREYAKCRDAG